MKKRIFVLSVCCIFMIILSGCKKEEEVVTPKDDNYISFVCSKDNVIYGVDKDSKVIKIAEDSKPSYRTYDIDNGYLYYNDTNYKLHKVALNNELKNEELNFTVDKDTWDIRVSGSNIIANVKTTSDFDTRQYKFDNKYEVLSFVSRNVHDYIYNGVYYYNTNDYDEDTREYKNSRLVSYNIETKESTIISSDASIDFARNEKLLYTKRVKDENGSYLPTEEVYLYNINKKESIKMVDNVTFSHADMIVLGSDDYVYYVKGNALMKSANNQAIKIEDLNKKNAEDTTYWLYLLENNRILLREEGYHDCNHEDGCADDGNGENTFYIYDITSNTLTEITESYSDLIDCSDPVYYKK